MSSPDFTTAKHPPLEKPKDFEAFWRNTHQQLKCYSSAHETRCMDQQGDIVNYAVTFNSWLDTTIKGYFLKWHGKKPRPLLIYTHGYNGNCNIQWLWARQGFNVFGFDTRGFGRSVIPIQKDGWILTGIESAETSILRGAVCDYIRAAEVARLLADGLTERTLFYGYSFGGAMALMAEAVCQCADVVAAGVPSFGWMAGRRKLVKMGSGQEVNHYIRAHPELQEQIMQTLSYFDCANFAPLIKKPCLIGLGQKDIVVPAETVRVICNNLQTPHVVREFPYSHSNRPEEQLWQNFEREWLALGLSGLLPNG